MNLTELKYYHAHEILSHLLQSLINTASKNDEEYAGSIITTLTVLKSDELPDSLQKYRVEFSEIFPEYRANVNFLSEEEKAKMRGKLNLIIFRLITGILST